MRQRLHPLSPVLKGFRIVVVIVLAVSWQGLDRGLLLWLRGVGIIAVLALVGSLISYLVTGYEVVGRELRIYEGVLSRRIRAIPLERLQTVEIVRPLAAQLFGLAALRLEVVGGSKAEAPLAYLGATQAEQLRQRLLALARPAPTADQAAAGSGEPGAGAETEAMVAAAAPAVVERPLHRVTNRMLFLSQALRPQWIFLPVAIAMQIVWGVGDVDGVGFVAVASFVTALIGIVAAPIRSLLQDWNFSLATSPDGLRLRRGLTETRSQTVPLSRVQALVVQWPLLWRGAHWVRVRMHVAGLSQREEAGGRSWLLPVATAPVAHEVVAQALPGLDLAGIAVYPAPARARWVAPLRAGVLGFTVTPTAFVTRDGLFTRQLVIVPYARLQSVRVTQGPWQRRLGLASVWVDPAGGLQGEARAVALHRTVAEARALADDLAARARLARARL